MQKEYKFYACYKTRNGDELVLEARDSWEEAFNDLPRLKPWLTEDVLYVGVIRSRSSQPTSHLCHFGKILKKKK